MTRLTATALGLILCVAARAEESATPPGPLDGIAWLVGGQWAGTSKLPTGQEIESRLVATWGPDRRSLRLRTWTRRGEGEVQSYEAVLFRQPHARMIEYLTFAPGGRVYRGAGKIDGRTLTLEQEATGSFPALRQIDTPNAKEPDRYAGTSSFRRGESWVEAMRAVLSRSEVRPFGEGESRSPPRRLRPLDTLVGGVWSLREAGADGTLLERARWERSLGGSLLVGRAFRTMGDREVPVRLTVAYRDARDGRIRFLACSADGAIAEGGFLFAKDGRRWARAWTVAAPGGRTAAFREEWGRGPEDRFEVSRSERRGEKWIDDPAKRLLVRADD